MLRQTLYLVSFQQGPKYKKTLYTLIRVSHEYLSIFVINKLSEYSRTE